MQTTLNKWLHIPFHFASSLRKVPLVSLIITLVSGYVITGEHQHFEDTGEDDAQEATQAKAYYIHTSAVVDKGRGSFNLTGLIRKATSALVKQHSNKQIH